MKVTSKKVDEAGKILEMEVALGDESAREEREAFRQWEEHISKLGLVLTKEYGFPEIDYKTVVELSGRFEGAIIYWGKTLTPTPEYRKATVRICDTALKGVDILEKAYRPCVLPDDLYGRDARGTYEAMRDALFDKDAALSHDCDFIFEPVMPTIATTMHISRKGDRYEIRDGYARSADAGRADGSLTEGLIDGYFESIPISVTPPLVELLRGKVLKAFESPIDDEDSSFHGWVWLGGSCLDDGIKSGAVTELSLLYRMGDESRPKDERMEAFAELTEKYFGMFPKL